MRTLSLIKYNVRLQFRNGFYYAYLFVIVVYMVLLYIIPMDIRELLLPVLIMSDPAMLGFFFIGGIMLLEKDDNIYESMFVTPLRIREYIISKIASLSILGLLVSLIISFGIKAFDFNVPLLIFAVLITSPLYILIGMIAASRAKSLNEYMILTPFYIMILFAPLLGYFGATDMHWVYYLSPVQASVILFKGAFQGGVVWWEWIYAIGMNIIITGLVYLWARSWIEKYLLGKEAVP